MKAGTELIRYGNLARNVLSICLLLMMPGTASKGQENKAATEEAPSRDEAKKNNYTIRVGVDEVRIDVVVLDWKGNQITDLTAEDFVVLQDYKKQQITSCRYIDESTIQPDRKYAVSSDPSPSWNSIQRTMLFVMDGMSPYLLKTFAEKEMQPGYLVGIAQLGALRDPMFVSEQQQLMASIANWTRGQSIIDPEGFLPGSGSFSTGSSSRFMPDYSGYIHDYDGFLASFLSLKHYIRVLQDMPGRKNLVIVGDFGRDSWQYDGVCGRMMDELADDALRAGVVIHMLASGGVSGNVSFENSLLNDCILAKRTGGVTVTDNWEFSRNGISWLDEELKGYYLISYIPPEDTFDEDTIDKFHRVKVRTTGWFREVHSRNGFYGKARLFDYEKLMESPTQQDPMDLREALYSPYGYEDLKIHLSSVYSRGFGKDYIVESWGFLDPADLDFTDTKGEQEKVSLEALIITEDANGAILDSREKDFDIYRKKDLDRIRDNGLGFSVRSPIKEPGGYYVRAVVRDRKSGKIGKAYRFLEVPDLEKNRLALSGIFVMHNGEDMTQPGLREMEEGEPGAASGRRQSIKDIAVRSYRPGGALDCKVIVYNAKMGKDRKPELEYQFVLSKEGEEFPQGEIQAVDINEGADLSRVLISHKLDLGPTMRPGKYELKIIVTDKQAKKKQGTATQTIDFEIL